MLSYDEMNEQSTLVTEFNFDNKIVSVNDTLYLHTSESRTLESLYLYATKKSITDFVGDEDSYDDMESIFFSLDELKNNFLDYGNFIISEPEFRDDRDILPLLCQLAQEFEFSIDSTRESLSNFEFRMWLETLRENKTVMYYDRLDSGIVIKGIDFVSNMAFFGYRIMVSSFMLSGKNSFEVLSRFSVPMGKNVKLDDLPFRMLGDKQREVITHRYDTMFSSSIYREVTGNTFVSSMFRNTKNRRVSNERIILDADVLMEIDSRILDRILNAVDIYDVESIGEIENSEENKVLYTNFSVGFFINAKEWAIFDYNESIDVVYQESAFDMLILDSDKKDILSALIAFSDVSNSDFIGNKAGNGVVLLYGAPGTGKTLTAEAVAEKSNNPLYKVSLGELGSTPSEIEENLKIVLFLCARWDALLLIDEADVFLEERKNSDLERNAIVCLFLRLLEYHNGVIFLTTNRASNFDNAVVSRISFSIEYHRPDSYKLVTNLLSTSNIDMDANDIELLSSYDVNGRQMKNAINNAKSLSQHQGVELSSHHIELFLKQTISFVKHINL